MRTKLKYGFIDCITLDVIEQSNGFSISNREELMANPFVHIELHTHQPEKAKKFYGELFDWTLEDVPDMDYTLIKVGEGTGGGMMQTPMPQEGHPQWVPYILVEDVDASTAKAKSLGAKVLMDVTEIPDIGRFSMFLDPTGAAFALFEPKMPA